MISTRQRAASCLSMRLLALAVALAAAGLSGCSKSDGEGPTQVVAKVSQEEITELQVNRALERQRSGIEGESHAFAMHDVFLRDLLSATPDFRSRLLGHA